MKSIGRVASVIIGICVLASLCVPADAAAYQYSGKRKKVYCGIVQLAHLIPPTTTGGTPSITFLNDTDINTVALLFAKLDAMNSMKPAGWTFENPLAVTQNKYDTNYWRVPVGSARNLSRFNVLYFPASGKMSLTDEERENLRRFVDNGGTLWVDNVGSSPLTFDPAQPFFISQLSFASGANGPDAAVSRHHPLVCSPYWLTDIDIMSLGLLSDSSWTRARCDVQKTDLSGSQPTSFDVLYKVVDAISPDTGMLEDQPSVVANTYGSGRVVATANAVGRGCLLNEPYSLASLKLAYNIMSYASSWTDIRKNPRHSGASIDTLGSNRLVEKWTFEETEPAGVNKDNAALIYKDTVFYTSGNTLYALDANGDTHGGVWGPPTPKGAVVIWQWSPSDGARLGPPTIATMQNPAPDADCSPIEAVLVQDDGGTVYVLPAFPIAPNNLVMNPVEPLYIMQTAAPASGTGGTGDTAGKWPSPPIYINGWIYALGGEGRMYARNPCLEKWSQSQGNVVKGMAPNWELPSVTGPPFAAEPKSGPSFGFIKNTNSGAIVGMVYWWTAHQTTPPAAPSDMNDRVWGCPVSVSMDRARIQNIDSTRTHCEVVVSHIGWLNAPDPNNPESALRMLDKDGITPIPIANVQLNMNAAGATVAGFMKVTTSTPIPAAPLLYASYSLSYGSGVLTNPLYLQIEPQSPDPSTGLDHNPTAIAGTPAMGPDNMMFLCGSRQSKYNGPDGGSVLAYRTDGVTGNSKLRWHYFLHSGVENGAPGSSGFIPGASIHLPGVIQGAAGPMINPQPCSSPAVAGDKVFVTVSGDGPGPRAALLCFKANPEFVIRITEGGGYDAAGNPVKKPKSLWRAGNHGHYDVKLWQPNLINAATGAAPLMDARLAGNGVSVDYDNGTITFTDFAYTKLAVRGSDAWLANTFSPSLPVWVFLDNIQVPIDWTTWGPGAISLDPAPATSDSVDLGNWNNLLWYYPVPDPCTGAHSPPVVIGNTVYFITDDGMLYAFDTETGESGGKQTKKEPIWYRQVGTALGDPKAVPESVAGSNGILLVPSGDGLHAFSNTTTLATDNNRVVEIDGEGEVTWSVDSISWPATVPQTAGAMAIRQGPVNKPCHARYASTGEVLFANSGANQVCKIDKGGMVGFDGTSGKYIRWIYDKFVDPKHLLRSGQPTSLRAPTDAIMWQEMEPMPTQGVPGKGEMAFPLGTSTGADPGTSVVHCLIADSGNSRILDLVYRVRNGQFVDYKNAPVDNSYVDADSGFVIPELNWVTKTDSLNERYAFDCIQLVGVPGTTNFRQDIWAASSNFTSNGTDSATAPKGGAGLGGAVLAIGYRQRSNGNATTAPGSWDYGAATSGTIVGRCDHVTIGGNSVPLANPRFLDVFDVPGAMPGATERHMLVCDNYGVYEVLLNNATAPPVVASLLQGSYSTALRDIRRDPAAPEKDCNGAPIPTPDPVPLGVPLVATSVQRLPNSHWLITNGYSGADKSGTRTFNGEAFEYDPAAGGGATLPPTAFPWCSPRLQRIWIRNPGDPACAGMWGDWKQVSTNTYDLRQPKSAFRQF